jgi:hypothetical protein
MVYNPETRALAMVRMMSNDWLQRVGSKRRWSDTMVLDALFDLTPRDVTHILQNIRDYDGTKIVVSCTEDTDLESVLKLSLCLASVTIVVPAPLWVSCSGPESRYCEFNYASIGTNGWNSAAGVHKKISDLAVRVPGVFDDGVVTFLPVLGDSLHRWSDPELDLPELASPYSKNPKNYTILDIQMEALYGLCSERLVTETMGAIHLNSVSFLGPVLNDFWIQSKIQPDNGKCNPVEVSIPDFSVLSTSEVLQLRQEFAADFSRFTTALRDALQPCPDSTQTAEQAREGLRVSTANLSSRLRSVVASQVGAKNEPRQVRVLSLGNNSGVRHALNFLAAGGEFQDFINLITGNHRLKIRDKSLFAAS